VGVGYRFNVRQGKNKKKKKKKRNQNVSLPGTRNYLLDNDFLFGYLQRELREFSLPNRDLSFNRFSTNLLWAQRGLVWRSHMQYRLG
jgi:hypothetical protein